MPFRLKFFPHAGGGSLVIESGELDECRSKAAHRIRRHRNVFDYPVSTLDRGTRWELESDPDGFSLVSDSEGVLAIERTCDVCGHALTEQEEDDAGACDEALCERCQDIIAEDQWDDLPSEDEDDLDRRLECGELPDDCECDA